jgi:hypothetical protein
MAAQVSSSTGDPAQPYDVGQLDDFQVITERSRVMAALADLTARYRALNREMSRRQTLRWMVAP